MRLHAIGPTGTFSHETATELYPEAEIVLHPNFNTLFQTIDRIREDDVGFVPIENSIHGPVDEVLRMLMDSDMRIWRAHDKQITHALGGLDQQKIKYVASHSQALAQCQTYLRKNLPNVELFPVFSTSHAIELALEDENIAAIASPKAHKEKKLNILDEEIEENNNVTRFGLIAHDNPFPEGEKHHTSLILYPKINEPGTLCKLLAPFSEHKVDLTKIESRPACMMERYFFFLDALCCQDDERMLNIFADLEPFCEIKVIGEW